MNNKLRLRLWLIILVSLSVTMICLAIIYAVYSDTEGRNSDLISLYQRAETVFNDYYKCLETLNTNSLENCSRPKFEKTAANLDYKPIAIILLLIVCITSISSFSLIYFITKSDGDRTQQENKRQIQQAREAGRVESMRTLAIGLVSDEDILDKLVDWLLRFRKGQAQLDESARIVSQVLEKIINQTHLSPFGQIGSTIQFDPNEYATYDQLAPGDQAVITEVGWKVSEDVIKKPIARRQK